jgi:glutamate-1-semialdehyde 2,1-aminomutase
VWDTDGREFIEYALGMRSVTLGHAYAPVVEAAIRQMQLGANFTGRRRSKLAPLVFPTRRW